MITIIDFVQIHKNVLSGLNSYLSPAKAILQDLNEPKPKYPYITCKFTTPFSPEGNFAAEKGELVSSVNPKFQYDYKYTRQEQPTMTLSITAYSKTIGEAETYALKTYEWFKFTGYDYLKSKNLIVVECTDITDRDTLIIDDYERRKGFDVTLRTASELTNIIETIESVNGLV